VTPDQVRLVQDGFAVLAPRADEVAAAFYGELFALDPALRAMFPADMAGQRRKLMTALAAAVRALDRPWTIAPALEALGRRHAAYGVRDGHYDTVGAALLATLRRGLRRRGQGSLGRLLRPGGGHDAGRRAGRRPRRRGVSGRRGLAGSRARERARAASAEAKPLVRARAGPGSPVRRARPPTSAPLTSGRTCPSPRS
jgi:hemoglobin-like flavoprotein